MWSILYKYDAGITRLINSSGWHNWIQDEIVLFVTMVGIPIMVLAVAGQWWITSNRSQTRYILLTAGFSFLLALTLNQIIIFFVQRVRPYNVGVTNLLGSPSVDSSFPSDHASAAFAIAFVFLLHAKFRQGTIFVICASLVALSRVYVGTHYMSDVFGGMLTAFTAAVIIGIAYRKDGLINQRLVKIL